MFATKRNFLLPIFHYLQFHREASRFSASLYEKQLRMLDRFDHDIETITQKLNTNQKVKIKRNKKLFAQTLEFLKTAKITGDYDVPTNVPSGSPDQLIVRRDGMKKSFLSTRMKILNNNFMRAVCEILATENELSKKIEEYKVRITQVRVTKNYHQMQIYWVTDDTEIDRKIVSDFLNSNRGLMHEMLISSHVIKSVPWISFIYDLQATYEREIENRLKIIGQDFANLESNPDSNVENSLNSQIEFHDTKVDFKKQVNVNDFINEIDIDDYLKNKFNFNTNEIYKSLKLNLPEDMSLNMLNLDYESLMNKVLQNMHITRAHHRQLNPYLHSVGEHLPPIDPASPQLNNEPVFYNTEERINAIKKFSVMNKKNKNYSLKKLEKMLIDEENHRLDEYEHLRDAIDEQYSKSFENYDDYEQRDFIDDDH